MWLTDGLRIIVTVELEYMISWCQCLHRNTEACTQASPFKPPCLARNRPMCFPLATASYGACYQTELVYVDPYDVRLCKHGEGFVKNIEFYFPST